MMIRNESIEINELAEKIADLEYSIAITESGLQGCEDQKLFEQLFNELVKYKTELAILKDTYAL